MMSAICSFVIMIFAVIGFSAMFEKVGGWVGRFGLLLTSVDRFNHPAFRWEQIARQPPKPPFRRESTKPDTRRHLSRPGRDDSAR